mmetsp:Transcript_45561/g.90304  ORF Transcript_45561/g.90304 Transcript_45561/m.90304 type:complete len:505 (-) Transcript_45561:36-1550(-)
MSVGKMPRHAHGRLVPAPWLAASAAVLCVIRCLLGQHHELRSPLRRQLPLAFAAAGRTRESGVSGSSLQHISHCSVRRAAEEGRRSGAGLWPELFSWVKGTGMDTSDIAIEVAPVDLAPGELGLLAKAPLEPGDILAWAPTSLLLTKAKAIDVWGQAVESLQDRMAIQLLLVHERFVRKSESLWSTYMKTLPRFDGDVSGPSFLWDPEEWECLEGSDGYGASVQMHQYLRDEYEELSSSLFADDPTAFPPEVFTWPNYLWAAGCAASRAYGDDFDGTNLAIAPLVDFLNHRSGALQLTRFSNGIVAYAHKHFEVGEQVWVSYGGKSNAQLLTQYGFVDDNNLEEAIYLRIGDHLEIDAPHKEAKLALLEELLERPPEAAILKVALRPRDWDAELVPVARILALGPDDVPPSTARDLLAAQPPRLEAAAWQLLGNSLIRRREEYPASLGEDRRQLTTRGLSERRALALKLRISEQELIELALGQVTDRHEAAKAQMLGTAEVEQR